MMKKIIALSLLLPLVSLAGEACLVPLAMAENVPMRMSDALSGTRIQDVYDDGCFIAATNNCDTSEGVHFISCLSACAGFLTKTLFIKEIPHTIGLTLFHPGFDELSSFVMLQREVTGTRTAPPGIATWKDAHLSVEKKE